MRSGNGGLAHGTRGNPQTNITQEIYAAKVAEMSAAIDAEAVKAEAAEVVEEASDEVEDAVEPDDAE